MNIKPTSICVLVAAALLRFCDLSSAQTTNVIYQDSFSRTGYLNGTAPDVTGTGGAVWTSATNNTTDGTEVFHNGDQPAYLPLQVVQGHIYTLSFDMNATNGGTLPWLAAGFLVATNVNLDWFSSAGGWLLQRSDHSEVQAYQVGVSGGQTGLPGGNASGPTTFSIVLDASGTQWTISYMEGGTLIGYVSTYSSNPAIVGVGFGGYGGAQGTIDNFTLTDVNTGGAYPPVFALQPDAVLHSTSVSCFTNASFAFTVSMQGTPPFSYQWMLDGVNIAGATNPSLSVASLNLGANETHSIDLTVTNAGGTAIMDTMTLATLPCPVVAYTNYLDNFSGTGSLNGRTPNVDGSGYAWYGGENITLDGSGQAFYNGAGGQALLPFRPQWGHVYTLSVDLNPTIGDWISMGFTSANDPAQQYMYNYADVSWTLAKTAQRGVQAFTYDLNNAGANQAISSLNPGYVTITMVLDTTTGDPTSNSGWTMNVYENGVWMNTGTFSGSVTSTNPPFQNIVIGGEKSSGGYFRNLLLTDSQVPPPRPVINTPPLPAEAYTNGAAIFSVAASGGQPLYYQWQLNGTNLPAATNTSLSVSHIVPSQAGLYSVIVSNSTGTATASAALTVLSDPSVGAILYSDSFSTAGALNGHVPDLVDASGAAWVARSGLNITNGAVDIEGYGGGESCFLPFIPQWGHIYVLAADMNTTAGNWLCLGFTTTNWTGSSLYNTGAREWLLLQPNQTIQAFDNSLSGNSVIANAVPPGMNTIKLVLDTTTGDTNLNTGWTVRYVAGRNVLKKTVYTGGNLSTFYVAIGAEIWSAGSIDNFQLTDSVTPLNQIRLGVQQTSGGVVLSWPQGTLLETTNLVTGPWVTNTAVSPFTVVPDAPQKFYRLRLQ